MHLQHLMLIDCHNHLGMELHQYLRGEFPYAQHFSTLLEDGARNGIARFVVFPMVTNFAMNLRELRDNRVVSGNALENVPYAFENRRLMREVNALFEPESAAAIPFAMFDPLRETAAQERALRALHSEYSLRGLKTQTTMLQAHIKSLLDEGRVFLELAREWNLPLLIHSSVLPSDAWAQARDIIDIAEKCPDVRFNVAHSCRFDKTQLDRIAQLPNTWFDCSAHGIHCALAQQDHPSIAPRERRFDSDYTQPARVLADLDAAYQGKLMWGSDSPYYSYIAQSAGETYSLRSSYQRETSFLHALPEETKNRIANSHTRAWLGEKS